LQLSWNEFASSALPFISGARSIEITYLILNQWINLSFSRIPVDIAV